MLDQIKGGELGELTQQDLYIGVMATGAGCIAHVLHLAVIRVLGQTFMVMVVVAAKVLTTLTKMKL